jgi:uncharacterized protein
MRILLDTNVLIAAFVSRGTCSELVEHCVRNHSLISSSHLIGELEDKLSGKLGFSRQETRDVINLLRDRMILTEPVPLDQPVCRDPDDDLVLAAAQAGECDCIVTGDKDLLVLERFRQIPIVTPADFWRLESV